MFQLKISVKHIVTVYLSCCLIGCAGAKNANDGANSENGGRQTNCISGSTVRGYSVLDDSNLVVDGIGRRKYHITLGRRSHQLRSSRSIAFDSRSVRICAGFDDLLVAGIGFEDRLRIQSIRELSEEEHEDLLVRYGKKEPENKKTPAPQEVEGARVEELDPTAADDSSSN